MKILSLCLALSFIASAGWGYENRDESSLVSYNGRRPFSWYYPYSYRYYYPKKQDAYCDWEYQQNFRAYEYYY